MAKLAVFTFGTFPPRYCRDGVIICNATAFTKDGVGINLYASSRDPCCSYCIRAVAIPPIAVGCAVVIFGII